MDTKNDNNQTGVVIKRQVQIEAISKAVYLITDLFADEEPLKLSLRRACVQCLEKDSNTKDLNRLISLIKLSASLNLITSMNSTLLLKALYTQVESLKEEGVDLAPVLGTNKVAQEVVKDEEDKEGAKNIATIENKESPILTPVERVEEKMVKKAPSITIHNNTNHIKTINNISMDIGSRRKRILEIVRARGAVTINEFIEAIKGCSSKTIQRELTSLVLSGTLKKTGERRWSKYSLK